MNLATALAAEKTDPTPREIANRANAKLSTGPRTEIGKAKSSVNAVRSALTGRTVLLPSDDVVAYEHLILRFLKEYSPEGAREGELVQRLADTDWRLNRIPALEMGIFASGRIQFAHLFADQDPAVRTHLIDNHTLRAQSRQLNNLSIQETRLRRHWKADLTELKQLQAERRERTKAQEIEIKEAAKTREALAVSAKVAAASASAATDIDGFVFSSEILNTFSSALNVDVLGQHVPDLIKNEI